MNKKRKIALLLLAVGLFLNITSSTSSTSPNIINSTHSYDTLEKKPIDGEHWKLMEIEEKLKIIIHFVIGTDNGY